LQWLIFGAGKWEAVMLMTFVVILVVLWLLGMVTTYTLGGVLHILLVIAVILLLVRVIQGRPI
jgi:hypothetical protein